MSHCIKATIITKSEADALLRKTESLEHDTSLTDDEFDEKLEVRRDAILKTFEDSLSIFRISAFDKLRRLLFYNLIGAQHFNGGVSGNGGVGQFPIKELRSSIQKATFFYDDTETLKSAPYLFEESSLINEDSKSVLRFLAERLDDVLRQGGFDLNDVIMYEVSSSGTPSNSDSITHTWSGSLEDALSVAFYPEQLDDFINAAREHLADIILFLQTIVDNYDDNNDDVIVLYFG